MAPSDFLAHVDAVISCTSFDSIAKSSFASDALDSAISNRAAGALNEVKELLSHEGVPLASLKMSEVKAFVRDASSSEDGAFTLNEYQALLKTLTKYAALKARRNNGKRWGLGLGLSAAGAMALTAAVFTSAGLVLVAAPAGAAIGAVAVAADGSKSRRRDRRTAKASSSAAPTPAQPEEVAPVEEEIPSVEAAEAPAGPAETEAPAEAVAEVPTDVITAVKEAPAAEEPAAVEAVAVAPVAVAVAGLVAHPAVPDPSAPTMAPVPSSGDSSPRGSSGDEMVGAVVEFMSAPAAADADSKPAGPTIDTTVGEDSSDVPAPVQCDSPFTAASRDTNGSAYADVPLAPLAVRNSMDASSAALPPKPQKSKSLTKSMSKKLKKAFSIKDSSSKDAGAHKATDADSDSPLAPPVPPRKSGSFFRRSSDSFFRRSSSDLGGDLEVEGVEKSKGSATIKKMVDGLRRSFSLDRPSLDLVTPKKKARKEAAAN